MTELNEMIVDENDLVEGLLQGKSARYIITKDTEKIDSYNHFCTLISNCVVNWTSFWAMSLIL